LNVANPHVQEYVYGVAEHWLRFGIDGWRLDVPEEIDEPGFWEGFRQRCRAVDREAYLVGEIWTEAPDWLVGDRFDGLMNYPLGAAILGFAGDASLDRSVIEAHHMYRHSTRQLDGDAFGREVVRLMTCYDPAVVSAQLNLIGSHDAPRALTVLGGDIAALRLAFSLLLTLPGAPCIYYGDEIAMAGDHDPGCRAAYPTEPRAGDQALRQHVAALAAARHEHVALRRGTVRSAGAAGPAIALLREAEGSRALVAVNAGRQPIEVPLEGLAELDGSALGWRPLDGLVSAGARVLTDEGGEGHAVRLPPQGAAILVAD
jgi:neopullulanase